MGLSKVGGVPACSPRAKARAWLSSARAPEPLLPSEDEDDFCSGGTYRLAGELPRSWRLGSKWGREAKSGGKKGQVEAQALRGTAGA